jgi:hypothetical protein
VVMALLEDRPRAGRPVAPTPPDTRARLRPVHQRERHAPAAWLLDVASFHHEFTDLWTKLGEAPPVSAQGIYAVHPGTDRLQAGDTTALRIRATEIWNAVEPPIADVVVRLEVSAPEEWEATMDDRHLGHWFRLIMATHLHPVGSPEAVNELRVGLPALGFTQVEARRATLGREIGDLALELSPAGYGPAVSLSLGHGHKGWLGRADAEALRRRLAAVPPATFRTVQHLVAPCEALWQRLGLAMNDDDQALVLWSPG